MEPQSELIWALGCRLHVHVRLIIMYISCTPQSCFSQVLWKNEKASGTHSRLHCIVLYPESGYSVNTVMH